MYYQILERLDEWRHFPRYQLERHVDILFSFHLKRILEAYFKLELQDLVVPEFPVAKKLLFYGYKYNDTISVDFVLFSQDRGKAFFVELKTDISSEREDQDSNMNSIQALKFQGVINCLRETIIASGNRKKYLLLLNKLFLNKIIDVDKNIFNADKIYKHYVESIVPVKDMECHSVLLKPTFVTAGSNNGYEVIDFGFIINNKNSIFKDQAGLDFAGYLEKWKTRPEDDVAKYLK